MLSVSPGRSPVRESAVSICPQAPQAPQDRGRAARLWPRDVGYMTDKDHPPSELPLPCVLDDDDIDRLLERLRAVHGEPRRDIAPGLNRQGRARKAA